MFDNNMISDLEAVRAEMDNLRPAARIAGFTYAYSEDIVAGIEEVVNSARPLYVFDEYKNLEQRIATISGYKDSAQNLDAICQRIDQACSEIRGSLEVGCGDRLFVLIQLLGYSEANNLSAQGIDVVRVETAKSFEEEDAKRGNEQQESIVEINAEYEKHGAEIVQSGEIATSAIEQINDNVDAIVASYLFAPIFAEIDHFKQQILGFAIDFRAVRTAATQSRAMMSPFIWTTRQTPVGTATGKDMNGIFSRKW